MAYATLNNAACHSVPVLVCHAAVECGTSRHTTMCFSGLTPRWDELLEEFLCWCQTNQAWYPEPHVDWFSILDTRPIDGTVVSKLKQVSLKKQENAVVTYIRNVSHTFPSQKNNRLVEMKAKYSSEL